MSLKHKTAKQKLVTAADAGYFYSLLTLIQTLRTIDQDKRINLEIWDIGMEKWQRQILETVLDDKTAIRSLHEKLREPFVGAFCPSGDNFAWKPFCIRESLQNCKHLIWLDAGVALTGELDDFFILLEQRDLILLDNFDRKNVDWTSSECQRLMNFDSSDQSGLQISANIIGFTNSRFNVDLIEEWLAYCSIESVIKSSEPKHRHDQSVLSILAHRRSIDLVPFTRFAIEGSEYEEARLQSKVFLAHRRKFNWYDMNFLVNFHSEKSNRDPILSIVTVTFNDLNGLNETLKTIPKSPLIEWIIVDGGSHKLILDEIETIAANNQATLLYGPDLGIFHGMNKGLTQSQGKYILFLNSGDSLENDVDIEGLLEEISNLGSTWAVGDAIAVNHLGKELWKWPSPSRLKLKLGVNSYCHQASIVPRDFLMTRGGFIQDSMYSDWGISLLLRSQLGKPKNLVNLKIRFLAGGVSSTQTIDYWVRESSRLRIKLGTPIFKSKYLDRLIQALAGRLIRTTRGQLIRPDLK